jgi:hypothetical protein
MNLIAFAIVSMLHSNIVLACLRRAILSGQHQYDWETSGGFYSDAGEILLKERAVENEFERNFDGT